MHKITQLAKNFGLSRSTLLYYDRIGLLSPSGRSEAGYRLYSKADVQRLEAICTYRKAGLTLEDIRTILDGIEAPKRKVLETRLRQLGKEIQVLQTQQRILAGMLKAKASGAPFFATDKELWVEMFRAAGLDDAAMMHWHSAFEERAPEDHHAFLLALGISENEALRIRKLSRSEEGRNGEKD